MENGMKLRLHANSIRLRLSRNEVEQFAEAGRVEDAVEFGEDIMLSYVLNASAHANAPHAALLGNVIHIDVPASEAQNWTRTDRVEIAGEQQIGPDKQLSILIEKDFQCLHGEDEPDPEAFPNPLAAKN